MIRKGGGDDQCGGFGFKSELFGTQRLKGMIDIQVQTFKYRYVWGGD